MDWTDQVTMTWRQLQQRADVLHVNVSVSQLLVVCQLMNTAPTSHAIYLTTTSQTSQKTTHTAHSYVQGPSQKFPASTY